MVPGVEPNQCVTVGPAIVTKSYTQYGVLHTLFSNRYSIILHTIHSGDNGGNLIGIMKAGCAVHYRWWGWGMYA